MADLDIIEAFNEFATDLLLEAQATGESKHGAFFKLYSDLATENGDCPDLTYTPVPQRRDGRSFYQVDGFALDVERGELFVVVCDYRQDADLQQLHAADIDSLFSRARKFVELSMSAEFIGTLEETGFAFQAAYPIFERKHSISRIRLMVFSNARRAARRPPRVDSDMSEIPVVLSVLDFTRYVDIDRSRSGSESIEVDLVSLLGAPLPCLEAHGSSAKYQSYLIAMPGELLAQIYGLYGAKLLEQNVRTFLQARTKVNAGIIKTLQETPEMFFAYNNGITATATGLRTEVMPNGALGLAAIDNLQIVNGGQTTASILYARDQQKAKADLSRVFVQMKLSVVSPQSVEEVVPKISRYANTQNRISEADFASSDTFQITIQRISRRLSAPPRQGSLAGSKWFYERARGQYKDAQAYLSSAGRTKFELEYPKDQMIDKTDLAKYEMTWACKPHVVSLGAQKCFLDFTDVITAAWEKDNLQFNDEYFRRATSKARLFRWVDHMVATSSWYQNDRGYKAQIVTYTIAWLVNELRKNKNSEINLAILWSTQEVPEPIQAVLSTLAPLVAVTVKDAPSHLKNVGEYCKQAECWAAVSAKFYGVPKIPESLIVSADQVREKLDDASKVRRIDMDVEFDALLVSLRGEASRLRDAAESGGLLSPKSDAALSKIGRGSLTLTSPERNALKYLFGRLEERGVKISKPSKA